GIAGYYLGHFAYSEIAKPILALYGKLEAFEQLRSSASKDAVLLMLVNSGVAHLPPIKVVTILSGVVGVNVWLFIASRLGARGARFLFLALGFQRLGGPIRHFFGSSVRVRLHIQPRASPPRAYSRRQLFANASMAAS